MLLNQPASLGRQRHRKAGTKPPPTSRLTCIDRMGPKEKAARVQETTSLPTSAPAGCMIVPLAPKGIRNCTILLSIQIGVKGDHDAQQGLCQVRPASSCALPCLCRSPPCGRWHAHRHIKPSPTGWAPTNTATSDIFLRRSPPRGRWAWHTPSTAWPYNHRLQQHGVENHRPQGGLLQHKTLEISSNRQGINPL